MRFAVRRLAEAIPEYGLAFHGADNASIANVKKEGLHPAGYVRAAQLPSLHWSSRMTASQFFRRAVGSALYASVSASRLARMKKNIEEGDLPAIVILKGSRNLNLAEHDLSYPEIKWQLKRRRYPSFGVVGMELVPPENVAGVVSISLEEYRKIVSEKKNRRLVADALHSLLVSKTLAEVKKMVEK